MSNTGLSVGDLINVGVSLSPQAAAQRNFGSLLILGDSDVIDTFTRFRTYTSAAAVASDFGGAAPEAVAATEFFGQTPQPQICYVGAWARQATSGSLIGGTLGSTAQALANFTAVTNGGLNVTVDAVPHALSAISFAAATNLNGVASALQAAIGGVATVFWDANNSRFVIESATTGAASSVSFGTANTGTDLSSLMNLKSGSGAYAVNGIVAETPLAAATQLASMSNAWYGLQFNALIQPADADYQAVSAFIQGLSPSRVFGITTPEAAALNATSTTDLAALIQANRTFIQYSSSSPAAACAAFGDAFTVDFAGADTLYTLMYKQESGITAETLTETQAQALKGKFCNVYVNYNNNEAILQHGVMSDGTYFDVIHGTDWLQNAIQTAIFNLFLTNRKIAQTDAGVNQIVTTICGVCDQGVENGLIAPGQWNGPPIGAIRTGQTLAKGYYVYAPTIASQTQAARANRQAPSMAVCIKLAGAIHEAPVLVSVNQ